MKQVSWSIVVASLCVLMAVVLDVAPVSGQAQASGPQTTGPHATGPQATGVSNGAPAGDAGDVQPPPPRAAVKPPDKQGFARVVPSWPTWLTLSMVERGRVESVRAGVEGRYDSYYLNRLRLTAGFVISRWLQATIQGQDSRVGGYQTRQGIPASVANSFDLRLALVDLGTQGVAGASATLGRQELTFGDGRVMASSDWGNVSRTYDSARVSANGHGVKVDAFFGAPVDVTRAFSLAKIGERVGGVWATFAAPGRLGYVDAYGLAKSVAAAVGERGVSGSAATYAVGVRAGGRFTRSLGWEMEHVWETGHSGSDTLAAFGTHAAVTWTASEWTTKPRLTAEYNYASGDDNPSDGTRGTFDQLYASTHAKWGLADLVGWRNMHHAAVKGELSATRRLKLTAGMNHLWLATARDGWYGVSGARVVLNRQASSRDLGWEPDLGFSLAATPDLSVGAGVGVLFAGAYVRQSLDFERLWAPYATVTVKF